MRNFSSNLQCFINGKQSKGRGSLEIFNDIWDGLFCAFAGYGIVLGDFFEWDLFSFTARGAVEEVSVETLCWYSQVCRYKGGIHFEDHYGVAGGAWGVFHNLFLKRFSEVSLINESVQLMEALSPCFFFSKTVCARKVLQYGHSGYLRMTHSYLAFVIFFFFFIIFDELVDVSQSI